jgi:hypothetical protein
MALVALLSLAASARLRPVLHFAAALLLVLLAVLTRHNAALWSQPELQAAMWYHDNPGSLRSTLAYGNLLLQKGEYDKLQDLLREGARRHPNSLAIVVSQRYVRCYWQQQPTRFDDLPALARQADYEVASVLMLEQMRSRMPAPGQPPLSTGACRSITPQELANVYLALLQNPPFAAARLRTHLFEYTADIAVAERRLNEAMYYYDQAFASQPLAIYPYRQALLLQSAGLDDQIAPFLDRAEAALTGRQRLLYPELAPRIAELRQQLGRRGAAAP